MKKALLVLLVLGVALSFSSIADAKKPFKPIVINKVTNVTNVTNVVAKDNHNVAGVKVDAPNLVKIDDEGQWTLGVEGGKDIIKDVFYDSDYFEADRGYFAYLKVTYSGCLLNCGDEE